MLIQPMAAKQLTAQELTKIAHTRNTEKRLLNFDVYIEQLLAHAAWTARRIAELEK